jgi:hypothetical protein
VTLYSVYEPPAAAPDLEARAEGLTFVRQGFSWGALLVPAIWLLYRRMWLELILFVLLLALLAWAAGPSDMGQALLGWGSMALVVLFAFAANDLRAEALERRGYRLAGIANGRGRDAAELAFFRSWLPRQLRAGERGRDAAPERTALAKAPAPAERRGGDGDEVIGLFPRP